MGKTHKCKKYLLAAALYAACAMTACGSNENTNPKEQSTMQNQELTTAAKQPTAAGQQPTTEPQPTAAEQQTPVISGGQAWIFAPTQGEIQKSEAFRVDNAENVTWEIVSSGEGVSISADGVVTITDTYVYGDINGTDIIFRAKNGEVYSENQILHVREPERIASFDFECPTVVKRGQAIDIVLSDAKNQYGEEMQVPDLEEIEWSFTCPGVEIRNNQIRCSIPTLDPEIFIGVRADFAGVAVEKRFILVMDKKYELTEEKQHELNEATLKYLSDIDFSIPAEIDKTKYVYINKNIQTSDAVTVDVSDMLSLSDNQLYQISLVYDDGSLEIYEQHAENNKIIVETLRNGKHAASMEVSPVYLFALGKADAAAKDNCTPVGILEAYTPDSLYGFYGSVENINGGVSLKGENSYFIVQVPDGFYNIRLTKPMAGTGRSTIRINDASLGTNVGNPGSGSRTGSLPYVYLMEDVCVEGGRVRISLSEKDFTLAYVEIRKAPEIAARRTHIYIGGDSTVSNYYPIETAEPLPGRAQTGWGQVFCQYVTEDMVVTNLAGGGTYAKSWYEMAFPGVIQNGQPGDYFIIHAGINDRSYSNQDEMVEYLNKMIDSCEEKGITIILTTAMQSPKFWRSSTGQDTPEFGTPEGGGLAAFMDSIRTLAKERNVFLVDVGALSGEWYSVVGRTYVAQNYHIYNAQKNVEEDTLHLSYHGALKIAELVATELKRMQSEGAADYLGHTLDCFLLNDLHTYTVSHTDANGNTVETSVTGVEAIYKKYGE